jgi:hypothetical protein
MTKSEMGRGSRSLPPHHDAGGHGQPMATAAAHQRLKQELEVDRKRLD